MLDTNTNMPALLPYQAAAPAHSQGQAPSGSRPVWCVVATKPKAERTALAALHHRGFNAYLPLTTSRWRDRTWHTSPLWPGYCFVQTRLDQPSNPIRYAPGVFSILAMDGKPSIVANAVISALRAGEALRASTTQPNPSWAPGVPCSLRKGHAFEGPPAVVLKVTKTHALVAAIFLGQLRTISVHLDTLTTPAGV